MIDREGISQPEKQVQLVPQFASIYGEPLLPPSIDVREKFSLDEFRDTYPGRFKLLQEANNLREIPTEDERRANKVWIRFANGLDRYAMAHYAGERRVLRVRQMACFDDFKKSVEKEERESSIEATMAFGKTALFTQLAEAAHFGGLPTIIATSRRALVEQIFEEFEKFSPHLEVGRFYGDVKELGRNITITTYNSLPRLDLNLEGLLVLDEAHRAWGEKRIPQIDQFKNAFILALSGTLGGKVKGEGRVANAINNRIHTVTIPEAVAEGYNCGLRCILARVKADTSAAKGPDGQELSKEELRKHREEKIIKDSILPLYLDLKKRHEERYETMGLTPPPFTTLAYTSFVENGELMAKIFNEAGIVASSASGKMKSAEINTIVNQLRSGVIAVGTNAQLFREGTNIQSARLIINLGATNSLLSEAQRSGRGLRIDPDDPFKETIILDVIYEDRDMPDQALFPNIVGAANLKYLGNIKDGKTESDIEGVDLSEIDNLADIDPQVGINLVGMNVGGITIVTKTEEVMVISRSIGERSEQITPSGWLTIGKPEDEETICYEVGRSTRWISSHIEQALNDIAMKQDEQKIPFEDREDLFREYLAKNGGSYTHYAPEVIERLKIISENELGSTERSQWMPIGNAGHIGTLCEFVGTYAAWIESHLSQAIEEVEKEYESLQTAPEDREPISKKIKSKKRKTAEVTGYSVMLAEKLKEIYEAEKENRSSLLPPVDWHPIGDRKYERTVSFIVDKKNDWVNRHLSQAFEEIDREDTEKGIPLDKRELLYRDFTGRNRRPVTYYSPRVTAKLQEIKTRS